MRNNRIPGTDIEVSEWSLGCSGIGGPNQLYGKHCGWPEVGDDEVLAAIRRAVDLGINHFDTADLYGCGESERRLSRTLLQLGLRPDDFVISSKVGWLRGSAEHPYDPWHMKRQCEQSLRNLKREVIDIYYLHNAEFGTSDEWLEPAAQALDELLSEGKIRVKGQSAYTTEDFEKTTPVVRPRVLQSRANLLDREFIAPGSGVQRLMEEHGIGFIAFSPLAQGLLSDAFDPEHPPNLAPANLGWATRASRARFSVSSGPGCGR